jgi:hypothetical protein
VDPNALPTLETFLKVTGPFGVIAALLYLVFWMIKQKAKDDADFAVLFEAFLVRFTEHDTVCKTYQRDLLLLTKAVEQNGVTIREVSADVRRERETKARGGRAGM